MQNYLLYVDAGDDYTSSFSLLKTVTPANSLVSLTLADGLALTKIYRFY